MKDNVYNFIKKFIKPIFTNSVFLWIISSIALTLLVEYISLPSDSALYGATQHSLSKFIYNLLLIMLTSSFIFLFKRRIFLFSLVSTVWLGLSLGNKMLLIFRGSPLTISDIQMINMGITLIDSYFTKVQIYLIAALVVILLGLFILLFIKGPKKQKVNYLLVIPSLVVFVIGFKGYSNNLFSKNILSTNFWDINNAYKVYGFPYSFSSTVMNYGIDKPSGYSKNSIYNLVTDLNSDSLVAVSGDAYDSAGNIANKENIKPNIIMVQLESFFDPMLMNDLTFSEDPIPNFRRLSEEYTSGTLTVPTIGGGTSNTEFECITGLAAKLFGPGQFPYNSLLQTSTSESIAYYLKDQGYATTAMHNHEAIFYGRNVAYANLGFDRFVPRETMNVEYTPTYYAKDTVFINDIPQLISFTEEKDFIYAVSVQGHGAYPNYEILPEINITVDGDNLSEGDKNSWQYYVQQIHEMDQMVMDLINKVNENGEPTIIAFYGDHLPSLGISNARLNEGTIYDTPLLIWDNIGLEKEHISLHSYQLSAYLLDRLDIPGGIVSSLHQLKSNDKDYLDELHALQYDILYGKKYAYNEENLYTKTDMKFGFKEPGVGLVEYEGDLIILKGGNFTENSKVCVNGKEVETAFYGDTILAIPKDSLKPGDTYTIRQVDRNGTVLMETFEYAY